MFSNRPVTFVLFYLVAAGCCYSMTVAQIADPTSSQAVTAGTSSAPQVRRDTTSSDVAIKPLFDAVHSNDPQAVRDAIKNGSYINGRNAFGFTPLHFAAALGHLKAMSVLLTAKADPEVANNAGDRPIHLAADYGRGRAAALLISAGADAHPFGQGGLTPLLRASRHNSTFALLKALSATNMRRDNNTNDKETKVLWTALDINDFEAARAAIANGADMEWRDRDGWTALHRAAAYGSDLVISVLLRAGADQDAVNNFGNRPLHWAAGNGEDGAVALLAVAGADLHSKGVGDRTPLEQAVRDGHTSTAALLRALAG